jgi:hypothetical protein
MIFRMTGVITPHCDTVAVSVNSPLPVPVTSTEALVLLAGTVAMPGLEVVHDNTVAPEGIPVMVYVLVVPTQKSPEDEVVSPREETGREIGICLI